MVAGDCDRRCPLGKRTWIKVYCDRWVGGSIREESPALRGIFIDLLALAGSGSYGEVGQIKLANEVGLPDVTLEKLLRLTEDEWIPAKLRLVGTKRITVTGDNIITIVNWSKYQSEYQRLREYTPKGTTESTAESTAESTSLDKRVEIIEEDVITLLFTWWNQQGIVVHQKLTDSMKRAIATALKEYDAPTIMRAMTQYAEITLGDEYFFNYKWTLRDFLKRGLERFSVDIEILRSNFKKDGQAKGIRPKVPARNGYSGTENLG